MGKYFGTDGVRDEANNGNMSPSFILKIGQAFGIALCEKLKHPKVIIGKDTRVSGYMIEGILTAGLCSVGVDVLLVGPLPTPGIAYLTRGMRASAGIVISASHNPFQDNGIKLFDKDGFKLPDSDEAYIEELIDSEDLEKHLAKGTHIGRAKRVEDAIGQYSVFLKERFPKSLKLDGVRIVLDAANGAAYKVAPKVFQELGAEVFCIHNEPNGMNINLESGALNPGKLQEMVLQYRANIGLAFDGDADRLVVISETGDLLDGDQILAMCALEMKYSGELTNDTIAVTVMSNMGLDLAMAKAGINVVRTAVGDRYVVEEMRKRDLVLGGEQSGHLLFLDSSTTGDGIIAALKILEMVVRKNKPLSELATVMERFPQITKNIRVPHKIPLKELPKFGARLAEIEAELSSEGRILFRYSGTESLARITIEAKNDALIKSYAKELEELLVSEISVKMQNQK